MNATSIHFRQLILEDARERILKNHSLEQIAVSHGINKKTLNKWLMSMGEEHRELRKLWVDNMLAKANEEIDNVKDNISLENNDSKQEAATWCSERKKLYRTSKNTNNWNSSG
jgi:transposase-like protein